MADTDTRTNPDQAFNELEGIAELLNTLSMSDSMAALEPISVQFIAHRLLALKGQIFDHYWKTKQNLNMASNGASVPAASFAVGDVLDRVASISKELDGIVRMLEAGRDAA